MVFMGLEQPIGYEKQLIFDPTTAKMVLDALDMYVSAMREDYLRGLEEMKEFQKEYGDFITPIAGDLEWFNRNFTGKVRDFIEAAYENGINLAGSHEGRLAMSRLLNSLPYGEYAKKRERAKNAEEYYKNMAVLRAADQYNEEFSRFLGEDPNQWAPNFMGVTSPTVFKTLKGATNDWFDNRTLRSATTLEKIDRGLDVNYDYKLFTDDDLLNIARDQTPGWQGTAISRYYRDIAKRQLLSEGNFNPSAEQIEDRLLRNIASAQQEWLAEPIKGDADAFALENQRTINEDWLDSRKQYREDHYKRQYAKDHPTSTETGGYDLLGDFYSTTLALAAGREYFPQGGATPETLELWLEDAKEVLKRKIKDTEHVLDATGMFMSPEKIRGIIPSNGKNGNGEFLDRNYFDNLHTEDDVRSSYDGWRMKGRTEQESREWREKYQEESKQIRDAVLDWNRSNGYDYKLKVVPEKDKNGNNTYGVVGSDGRWHTYVRVRVYMSDGKKSTKPVADRSDNSKKFIPAEGKVMLLEVGLKSNENAASPDLSISAREEVGPYAFNTVKKWTGLTGNKSFPWGANGFSSK